jgi:hypothetical protein
MLFVDAIESLALYGFRAAESQSVVSALDFFRSRGRDDEVARYEARLAELVPSSTAPIA